MGSGQNDTPGGGEEVGRSIAITFYVIYLLISHN